MKKRLKAIVSLMLAGALLAPTSMNAMAGVIREEEVTIAGIKTTIVYLDDKIDKNHPDMNSKVDATTKTVTL